ncbi:hypothetical protein KUTeg_015511 [Tegillarca granosa]|uniref:Zinc finger BED domain-containing 1-like n=1 Tax=Tegillarca granosa TaxID=220873 RepID=A0ABQ9ETY8_TEGGR|nr:hypothetical protein KUTeg_015511 [Tegillarca granosa]
MEGYLTTTAHFIDENYIYKNVVLATRAVTERHTGINTAKEISDVCLEFGINLENVVGLVTDLDNASNMVVCGDALKLTHVRCFGHTLQLAVNGALESVFSISRTISASKRDLKKRFNLNTDDFCKSVSLACTYLDPRYKSLTFLTEEQREIVINEIKSLSTVITGTSNEQHVSAANVPSANDKSDASEYVPCKRGRLDQDDMAFLLGEFYKTDCEIVIPKGID